MTIKTCPHCKSEFERAWRTNQVYCTKACRKEANREKDIAIIKNWHINHPECGMLRTVKHRAINRGLEFNLTIEDIVIPDVCPVFGYPLQVSRGDGHGGKYNSPSVDRIDNTLGYVKGNIQIISNLANAMKSTASPEQLLLFADWVYRTYGGSRNE